MGMKLSKTVVGYGVPVYQGKVVTLQGGFVLDNTGLAAGDTVKAGSLVNADETIRIAKVAKYGEASAAATNVATTYQVKKNSNLKVGQTVNVAGGTPRVISAIDTSNLNYDQLTLVATLGLAVNVGDVIYVNDVGYTAPNGMLYEDALVDPVEDVAVVIKGIVYTNRIPSVPAALQAKVPGVFFSKSF